jgi:hypothetical protein
MKLFSWQSARLLSACFLAALFTFPPQTMSAQTHVVSPADLQKQVVSSTQLRQQKIEEVNEFFSLPVAQQALNKAHMDPVQVKSAVSQLSDDDLARIAAQTDRAQQDFAAGALLDHKLELLVITIAVIIVIILIVKL